MTWTDQKGRTVGDNETYTSAGGTCYPGWDKSTIPGLTRLPDPEPTPPTAEEIQALVTIATQARLDSFARTRNYDGILSACTYKDSSVEQFAADGAYAMAARDATWAALYALLLEVEAHTKPMPTSFADVEPLLPDLVWPT
jgi:hypothetical protein